MSGAVAKKYVNALMKSCTNDELKSILTSLESVEQAFLLEKFSHIILSPDVAKKDKVALVLSLMQGTSAKLENFIKLLSENGRLSVIPLVVKELTYQLATKNNAYEGKIFTNFELSQSQIENLEKNFSKKFNATITLKKQPEVYSGIKVELDALGVEVSFSLDRLKSRMVEHILKAI